MSFVHRLILKSFFTLKVMTKLNNCHLNHCRNGVYEVVNYKFQELEKYNVELVSVQPKIVRT